LTSDRHAIDLAGGQSSSQLLCQVGFAIYVADPRFAAHYDERAPGLAMYVDDAIVASTATAGE
jgi:hypothetical protein